MPSDTAPWWTGTVGYEIYVRSFADGNGDGIGDLPGITAHLEHVAWLGADSVWITPFYPSPGFDHGYDVSDYRDISPLHGTLDDFDELVERAHGLGLRVITDIVPNHTSSQHRFFVEALEGPDSPKRDYYVWRDPAPDGGPPNNWVSHFGGPAWTLDEASGQYYCHLFLPEQPDLNWRNEGVLDAFDSVLRFWCERGVDGFRIDVAHAVIKDEQFRDNPQIRPITPDMGPREVFRSFEHRYDLDQDTNVDVYRRWNRLVEPYGAKLLGEVGTPDPARVARYGDDQRALHSVFFLEPVWAGWDPDRLARLVVDMHDASPRSVSWVINNHDASRSVTRYGGGETGQRRSLAMFTLMCGLGGTPFLFQGELGLDDGKVESSDLTDPISTRNPGTDEGRDGCRTPMPWDDSHRNGFTTAEQAWLPAADRSIEQTVEYQRDHPDAIVHRYRHLLATRREHPAFWTDDLRWLPTGHDRVLAGRRGDSVVVVGNLDSSPATVELGPEPWTVTFESAEGACTLTNGCLTIEAEAAAIATTAE